MATTLHAHLRHEEGEGLALIDATVTDEQWQEFGQENAKRIGPEAPIVFPWMLDGLDDVNTEHILSLLPEPVRAIYTNQWLGTYQQLDRWGATAGSSKGASSNLLRIPRGQDRQL